MRINTNISALNTLNQMQASDGAMGKSLERLSSGLRINRAADDAAGLAISEKMRNQIKGLNQARRNAQDGVSLIQTAEGALNETHSILGRMRELAIQASNDTMTTEDREQLQKEINLLIDEVDRISTDTEFNTKKLLNGDASENAKMASAFNEDGNVVLGAKATSIAETGTYKVKFSNKAASVAMGTITRSSGIESDYRMNSSDVSNIDAGYTIANLYSSSITGAGATFFTASVKEGTFFINGKEVKVETGDTIYKLVNKINNSNSGVGAKIDTGTGQIILLADRDAASNIKLEAGTSDFLSVAGFQPNTSGWVDRAPADVIIGDTADTAYLTGATAGSVRLANLQQQGVDGSTTGLISSDVITITGTVDGQVKTSNFTVGTSTVADLMANIENTFGGVDAVMERQRSSNNSSLTDFDETKTLVEAWGAMTTGDFRINGQLITYSNTDTIQQFMEKINAKSSDTGVTASLDRDSKKIVFASANNLTMSIEAGTGNVVATLNIGNAVEANDVNKLVIRGKDGASNAVTGVSITATDATGTTNRSVFNSAMTFDQMQVARDKGDFLGVAQLNIEPTEVTQKYAVAVKRESVNTELINGVSVSISKDIDEADGKRNKATITVGQQDGSVTLQIGANKGQSTTIGIEDMGATSLGLKTAQGTKISIMTRQDAQNGLDRIDNAIQKVSTQRSKLGAYQNRLEHTITNLGVSAENLTASESRIRDLDMAKEMSEFTRNQILMQAGTSMAAQANQKPQGIMKLLG